MSCCSMTMDAAKSTVITKLSSTFRPIPADAENSSIPSVLPRSAVESSRRRYLRRGRSVAAQTPTFRQTFNHDGLIVHRSLSANVIATLIEDRTSIRQETCWLICIPFYE